MSFLISLKNYLGGARALSPTLKSVILPKEQFRRLIEQERHRSGRNNNVFSLALIGLKAPVGLAVDPNHHLEKIVRQIRTVDQIGWFDNQRIGLLLPYTSREGVRRMMDRIFEDLGAEGEEALECHIFSYPDKQIANMEANMEMER